MRWPDFARARPDLASPGVRLLAESHGYAFLATVAEQGAPRLHPVAPILSDTGLFVAVTAGSPKAADLEAEPRFALHSTVVPPDDEEFWLRGRVAEIEGDPEREAALVGRRGGAELSPSLKLYEILLIEVGWSIWKGGRPLRRIWRADGSDSG